MKWIYLSPHFDDIALSCGGLVWQQARAGEYVSIWTICAGDPPTNQLSSFAKSLHARWEIGQQVPDKRRQEDIVSCKRMKATYLHFSVPDCIYRQSTYSVDFLYTSKEAIMGPLHPDEAPLVSAISEEISRKIAERYSGDVFVVTPLALGGHVDHRLTRAAAERLGKPLWYYADYPYVRRCADQLENLSQQGWKSTCYPITPSGQRAWSRAVTAHASQISTFWNNLEEMRHALRDYRRANDGILLWQPP